MPSFLERFEAKRRSTVSNLFLYPVRANITDPHEVVRYILIDHDPYGNRKDILDLMRQFPDEALEYARDRIEYEAVPYDERQKLKAQRQEQYQMAYMDTQPPTDKQISYIKALGGSGLGYPETRAEASRIIDALLKEKDGGQ